MQRSRSREALASPDSDADRLRLRARRLRDRADAIWFGAYQRSLSHGDHDDAADLERWARALEERADLRDAEAWQPPALPVLSGTERRQLGHVLDRLRAERERDALRHRARRARSAEVVGVAHPARYVERALADEAETVRAAPVGLRNVTLSRSAWAAARLVCAGMLSEGDVLDALVPAALSAGLPMREVTATVRGALRRRCRGAAA